MAIQNLPTAWEKYQKPELHNLISSFIRHQNFTLLTLYDKVTALRIEGFVLGPTYSRFRSKSLVIGVHPKHSDEVYLARIEYFAKLAIKDNGSSNNSGLLMSISIMTMNAKYGLEDPHKFG